MDDTLLFVLGLGIGLLGTVTWGCRTLPGEAWQFLASVPLGKKDAEHWYGLNFTYYGAIIASAVTLASAMLYLLMAATQAPVRGTLLVAGVLLCVCVPAAKAVARVVEGKKHTSTSGGASFVGLLLLPWVAQLAQQICVQRGEPAPVVMVILAAVAICYALGEGLGRLACLSFGCCYGKPLSQVCPALQRLFTRHSLVFTGHTKKIAYASGLAGQQVVPIQAVTSVLYISTSLGATLLFLHGRYVAAFLAAMLVTQVWRPVSECLRADYRGEGRLSAYQVMSLAALPYVVMLAWLFAPAARPVAHLTLGLQALWEPSLIVALQVLWCGVFVYFGRSTVTASTLHFHVNRDAT